MTRWLGAGLLIAAAPLAQAQRPDQIPAFRSAVDVVRLDVSVLRNGNPVRGLTAADFVVTDNGVQQVVDSVVVDQLPLSVQLVLDASGSVVGNRLTHLLAAADGLVAALRPGESAGLLIFSHRLRPIAPITNDLGSLDRRLGPGAMAHIVDLSDVVRTQFGGLAVIHQLGDSTNDN